mmetsp:Transcript_117670/g.374962  ORF Transcript_117670/g.374962 Transcript_117670/m.374962 type:complete len:279 (+) Transcript_117670:332-1168(+)
MSWRRPSIARKSGVASSLSTRHGSARADSKTWQHAKSLRSTVNIKHDPDCLSMACTSALKWHKVATTCTRLAPQAACNAVDPLQLCARTSAREAASRATRRVASTGTAGERAAATCSAVTPRWSWTLAMAPQPNNTSACVTVPRSAAWIKDKPSSATHSLSSPRSGASAAAPCCTMAQIRSKGARRSSASANSSTRGSLASSSTSQYSKNSASSKVTAPRSEKSKHWNTFLKFGQRTPTAKQMRMNSWKPSLGTSFGHRAPVGPAKSKASTPPSRERA